MASGRPFLIGEQWVHSGQTMPVVNPFTGESVAEVCWAGAEQADRAVQQAVAAFPVLRRVPGHARSTALHHTALAIERRREEFARTITREAGKPITDARREVGRAIQTFTVAAEEAKRIPGEFVPLDWTPGTEHYVGLSRRFPIGPVLGITPFNFPLNLVAHKVAPALACGNPIVLKPAPQTPLTALLLGEVLLEAGLPGGTISVVPCDNQVAEQLVTDPRVKLLSFTGSAAVGWMLKAKCGHKRVVLELGGNAGVIVEPDADLDLAVERCAAGGFSYAGQSCISVQRVYLHRSVYPQFVERLVGRVSALPSGDPEDDRTVVGPLINDGAARRVETWIQEAVGEGARVLTGGKRVGPIVEPTVIAEATPSMKVTCCEVFGPVVTVTPYDQFEDALRGLNDSDFGLQAGIFTRDVYRIARAYEDLEMGTVLANDIPTFRADHMPYGGVKESGLGREGVRYAIEDMTDLKLLVLNLKDSPRR